MRLVRIAALAAGILAVLCDGAGAAPPPQGSSGSSQLKDLSELSATKPKVDPETLPGAPVYHTVCAACHEGQVAKAPHKMFLQMMPPENILAALTTGLMKEQASGLSAKQRQDVAEYLGGAPIGAVHAKAPPRCAGRANAFDAKQAAAPVGWGLDNTRFIPAEVAGLAAADVPGLKLSWAFEFPGSIRARSQPTIAYGAVYVGSDNGTVYALDLATGCVRWTFRAAAEVRTGIVAETGVAAGGVPRLFFGDVIAHAYAVDARDGKLLWSAKVDSHPNATLTGTPAFHAGTVYVPVSSLEVTSAADPKYPCCKFRGAVVALDAASGAQRWQAHTILEEPKAVRTTAAGTQVFAPSGAPVWNSPTVDAKRGVLYVGDGENYASPANDSSDAVVAFRLSDGKRLWVRQLTHGDAWNVACMMQNNPNCPAENGPDVDVAASVLPYSEGGKSWLLVGQKNGWVYGLDPDAQGKVLWKERIGRGGIQGGVHFGMALEGHRLFVPIADMADGHDGRSYDMAPRPGLNALDARTGKTLWSAPAADHCQGSKFCDPGISAPLTAIPGIVFAGHMDGMLRAYAADTGKVVWEYDSNATVPTVSGASAHGGSFGGAGAAVRDGYLVINSGYGLYFHMPGNVLLVFSRPR
ncbi:MAG: PQQ-binding-like beta-propeller repeat protein [Proteobacteria bacterium]|nr:PQQ-binding-like beta-propeller repeat protein [Pseudomonadota bacterium]